MKDTFGRDITYLRVSVTELCNLRCQYCMPACGVKKRLHSEMMTEDELITAVQAAASLGITKVRVTGGEPLVKKNILSICARIKQIDGIEELCLTTNATLLAPLTARLHEAGVSRINISLDTLNSDRYRILSRTGTLDDALQGLYAALDTGFARIKLNAVLLGGLNDADIPALAGLTEKHDIDVRFIELMPIGEAAHFPPEAFITCADAMRRLPGLVPLADEPGVAKLYRLPGARGRIGFINPVSAHFCARCNRLRLTADGRLKPCLHSAEELSLKGMDFDSMRTAMQQAILDKPRSHGALSASSPSLAQRNMNEIGG